MWVPVRHADNEVEHVWGGFPPADVGNEVAELKNVKIDDMVFQEF